MDQLTITIMIFDLKSDITIEIIEKVWETTRILGYGIVATLYVGIAMIFV